MYIEVRGVDISHLHRSNRSDRIAVCLSELACEKAEEIKKALKDGKKVYLVKER